MAKGHINTSFPIPSVQTEDPDLALIARICGPLADEIKQRLIEIEGAKLPEGERRPNF